MNTRAPLPISVGVLVTLQRGPEAGGHVKCWERFAEAAVDEPGLDLTVYFLGDHEDTEPLGPSTRYITLPPRLGTNRFALLRQGAGDTDLAPHHAALARALPSHDVLHATDSFAFGRTARRIASRTGLPLVFSLHTHLPRFTRVYARRIITRALGHGLAGRLRLDHLALDRLRLHERAARATRRGVERIMRDSRIIYVSNARDRRWAADVVPADRIRRLRRGVNRDRFQPRPHATAAVRERHGLPDSPLVLFAGRVDDSKGVMLAGRAVRRLRDTGVSVHFVVAGEGTRVPDLEALLGSDVSCLGVLTQQALAELYSAADVFAFPSRSETVGNVVIEALSSGLPAVVAAGTSCAERVAGAGRVGVVAAGVIVEEDTVEAWEAALRPLLVDEARRAAAGAAARRRIERIWPTWADVVREDLLPVWREVGGRGSRRPGRQG